MKIRKTLCFGIFVASMFLQTVYAQVGINTSTPKASLDVRAFDQSISGNSAKPEGIIAPRFTGDELTAKTATSDGSALAPTYGVSHIGAQVYVTAVPSAANQAFAGMSNVNTVGYYYWDGALWQKYTNSSLGWMLGGNNNPSPSFLGTTSTTPSTTTLSIGVEGLEAMSITPNATNPTTVAGTVSTVNDAIINGVNVGVGGSGQNATGPSTSNIAIGNGTLTAVTPLDVNNGVDNIAIGTTTANTIFETSARAGAPLGQNTTGTQNLAIGNGALSSNTTGTNNIAVGSRYDFLPSGPPLGRNTVGYDNVAVGDAALYMNLDGYGNVAAGNQALGSNVSGIHNTAMGHAALSQMGKSSVTDNNSNIALGAAAGSSVTSATNSIFIGTNSGQWMNNSSNNIFIGTDAAKGTSSFSIGNNNIILGHQAGLYETGTNNIMIGFNAGNNTASSSGSPGDGNIYLGANAGNDAQGIGNVIIGSLNPYNATIGNASVTNSIVIGTGGSTSGSKADGVELLSGYAGGSVIPIGVQVGYINRGAITDFKYLSATTQYDNTTLNTSPLNGSYMFDVKQGGASVAAIHANGDIVADAGYGNATDPHNGSGSLKLAGNATIGTIPNLASASSNYVLVTDGTNIVQKQPITDFTTNVSSWLVGSNTSGLTAGTDNFLGVTQANIPLNIVAGDNTQPAIVITPDAAPTTNPGVVNIKADAIINGVNVGTGGAATSTRLGVSALNLSAQFSTAIGWQALANATGNNNTAVGYGALQANVGGTNNTSLGYLAFNGLKSGGSNIALGGNAGAQIQTGSNNLFIGAYAGSAIANGSGNVIVGGLQGADNSSNTVFIGTGGNDPATASGVEMLRMYSSDGVSTTGVAIGYPNTDFTLDGTGAYTAAPWMSTATSSGTVHLLSVNGNAYFAGAVDAIGVHTSGITVTSDKRLKTNIKDLQPSMDLLMKLRPVIYDKKMTLSDTTYQFKNEMGFLAQDLRKVLPNVVQEAAGKDKILSINYMELIPVLTKALQEQNSTIENLTNQVRNQQTQMEELKKMIEQLVSRK